MRTSRSARRVPGERPQHLDDLASLIDEHLNDVLVDRRLRRFHHLNPGFWGHRFGSPGDHVGTHLVGRALERSNAVLGEFQQRMVVGLKTHNRFQIVLEADECVGKGIEHIRTWREVPAREQRRSATPPITKQIRGARQRQHAQATLDDAHVTGDLVE